MGYPLSTPKTKTASVSLSLLHAHKIRPQFPASNNKRVAVPFVQGEGGQSRPRRAIKLLILSQLPMRPVNSEGERDRRTLWALLGSPP